MDNWGEWENGTKYSIKCARFRIKNSSQITTFFEVFLEFRVFTQTTFETNDFRFFFHGPSLDRNRRPQFSNPMKKNSARIDHFGIWCKDHFLELSTLLRVDWFGRESHYNLILYRTKDTTKLNASENTQPRKTREQKTQCKIIRERKHDREENAKTNYQKNKTMRNELQK